ncbi:Crp/Fnr family transcriptional regulator [Fulvimarina sp. MAC3]|uniref:Crp/Fnr family transcriptional regulator n=1 Tax=Fulvimarina sp. MAC3 TaxID=3148887 RepID=UPI0031FBB5D9
MEPDDLAAIGKYLTLVDLKRGDTLVHPGTPIDTIIFPVSGIVSIIAATEDNYNVEIGLFGREGMTDGSVLADVDRVPHEVFVQMAGQGLKIEAATLYRLSEERPFLRRQLMRWVHILAIQTGQTIVSNSAFNVEARLARWLLMCQDRIGGNRIELTHEFMGLMLAVRRSTVTLTIHVIEGLGAIKAERGVITIRDRAALEELAGTSYGITEREYERVIGPFKSK